MTLLAAPDDPQAPRIAADLAVLHERSPRVRLDEDLNLFAAVRTRHHKLVIHTARERLPPPRSRTPAEGRSAADQFKLTRSTGRGRSAPARRPPSGRRVPGRSPGSRSVLAEA